MVNKMEITILGIPYRTFKEKISITKMYLKEYKIQDLGGVLYLERKGGVKG